jgi:hypothetical protein
MQDLRGERLECPSGRGVLCPASSHPSLDGLGQRAGQAVGEPVEDGFVEIHGEQLTGEETNQGR